MLFAKNEMEQWISAKQANKLAIYYCPDCKQRVKLKQGVKMIHHFAHETTCVQQRFSEGETKEHLTGKLLLYRWLKKRYETVYLEPYLQRLKQRPDILVVLSNRYVAIEFQCSRIALDIIQQRTQNYKKHGIDVVWVVGAKNHHKNRYDYACLRGDLVTFWLDIPTKRLYACHHRFKQACTIDALLDNTSFDFLEENVCVQPMAHRYLKRRFLLFLYAEKCSLLTIPPIILSHLKKEVGTTFYQYETMTWIYLYVKKLPKDQVIPQFCAKFNLVNLPQIKKEQLATYIIRRILKRMKRYKVVCQSSVGKC